MEAILNSPLQVAQAIADPPPKPPDPTNGHTRGSHEHRGYEGEVDAKLDKDINLIKASLKEKTPGAHCLKRLKTSPTLTL